MKLRIALLAALLLISAMALFARHRAALLTPRVIESTDSMWLFEAQPYGTRYDFGAASDEGRMVSGWIASHQNSWKFSSVDFEPSKTQFVCRYYLLEFIDDKIILHYCRRTTDDSDSLIRIERLLSAEDKSFWSDLIARIKKRLTKRWSEPLIAAEIYFR